MKELKSVCVFAGSSAGHRPEYVAAARTLGGMLAAHDVTLVYGGASVGLMGAVADGVIDAGGRAVGVLPEVLSSVELAHPGLDELEIVPTMHDRKARMAELADGFVTLPGGLGSLEELFEAWTWTQLGIHSKPLGILNVAHFYDGLLSFLDRLVEEGFVKQIHRNSLVASDDAESLLQSLKEVEIVQTGKWVDAIPGAD